MWLIIAGLKHIQPDFNMPVWIWPNWVDVLFIYLAVMKPHYLQYALHTNSYSSVNFTWFRKVFPQKTLALLPRFHLLLFRTWMTGAHVNASYWPFLHLMIQHSSYYYCKRSLNPVSFFFLVGVKGLWSLKSWRFAGYAHVCATGDFVQWFQHCDYTGGWFTTLFSPHIFNTTTLEWIML